MATNKILAFAQDPAANVLTDAEYAALTVLLAGGFLTGIADAKQLNKVWRQSSVISAAVAQFMADNQAVNIDDSITIANLATYLKNAVSNGAMFTQAGTGAVIRSMQTKMRESVSVYDFGATGNGTTDDTAAIQAAIDSGASQIIFPYTSGIGAAVTQYKTTSPLNLTGLRGISFVGTGTIDVNVPLIKAVHTGHVFDCTGAFDLEFRNISVNGDATTTPICAWFLSRNNTNASAGRHRFYNCHANGKFSGGVIYNYASEENEYYSPWLQNTAVNGKAVVLTNRNISSYTSTFATVASGAQSNVGHRFYGGSYLVTGNGGSRLENTFYLDSAGDVSVDGAFMYCPYGTAHFYVNQTSSSDIVRISGIRGEVNANKPLYGIFFDNSAVTGTQNWSLTSARIDCSSSVVYVSDNTTLAGLHLDNVTATVGDLLSFHKLQDSYVFHASSTVTGRAGGTCTRNHFNGYASNRTLSGTNTLNTYINTNTGCYETSVGYKFPATQVPSSDVNTLDDYEEGTWTPALTCATPGNLSVVYSTQTGTYTKIGRLITVTGNITTTTFTWTTASGIVSISGLPFAATNTIIAAMGGFAGFTSAGATQLGLQTVNTTSSLYLMSSGSGQPLTNCAIATLPSGTIKNFYFVIQYYI